jgi:protein farnesyltransferase/geranylgeranyltransferase type-1 subunit alpha
MLETFSFAESVSRLYDQELEYVEQLLTDDIRNNSAWNQRFFLLQLTAPEGKIEGSILQKELEFTKKAIEKVPRNESAWNYLRG